MINHIEFLTEYVNRKRKTPEHIGTFSYLELGCDLDPVFSQIDATYKVGVDPVRGGNFRGTSDEYFASIAHSRMIFDLIFIDGDHASAQVTKDISNSLKYLSVTGLMVLHDVLPPSIQYTSSVYCNDAWRAFLAECHASTVLDVALIPQDFGVGLIRFPMSDDDVSSRLPLPDVAGITYEQYISEYLPKIRMLSFEQALEW